MSQLSLQVIESEGVHSQANRLQARRFKNVSIEQSNERASSRSLLISTPRAEEVGIDEELQLEESKSCGDGNEAEGNSGNLGHS